MEFSQFAAEAESKGMYLVNHENTDELMDEYMDALIEADKLCEINDPVATPFQSKYKAREILDKVAEKLEATKSIAVVENNRVLVDKMKAHVASIRVKSGTISWECEEPHNAQTDLELAAEFYFPELIEKIKNLIPEEETGENIGSGTIGTEFNEKSVPEMPELKSEMIADGMKDLNMLGILWSGRGQVRKSLLYLLCVNQLYEKNKKNGAIKSLTYKRQADIENTLTHNYFYLAQAYGNIGDTNQSSFYCHKTLQRQYEAGLNNISLAMDWVKNCAGISDFFFAMRQVKRCALSLSSAEDVLKRLVVKAILNDESNNINNNIKSTASEIEADLHRRWAFLDVKILKEASELEQEKQTAVSLGVDLSQLNLHDDYDDEEAGGIPLNAICEKKDDPGLKSDDTVTESEDKKIDPTEFQFFKGLKTKLISNISAKNITTFEKARAVFLRAIARIEAAKKYYLLDGYVTDHCTLVQEHSKLYHYLAIFESDSKRKLAMEARRIEMLTPLVRALSKTSYEVFHKQISYELGETALVMLDIKLDKFRERHPKGEIHEFNLKKAEITKCNDYSKLGLVAFTHFTYMYAPHSGSNNTHGSNATSPFSHFEAMPLHLLANVGCQEPDESLISAEEVRPYLNSHFLSCRILSKVIATKAYWPPGPNEGSCKTHFLVSCLRRYGWLSKFAPKICEMRGLNVSDVFREELKICQDMVELLPSKIDRMCFQGEGGLTL